MKIIIFALLVMTLSLTSFAQTEICADMSGNYKSFSNSNKLTIIQTECKSLEILDPRDAGLLLILDSTFRQVRSSENSVTFASAKFSSESVIDVDWVTHYDGSSSGEKVLRKLSYYDFGKGYLVDRFFMIKNNGSLALLFEESWIKE
jgi:hypothetical protein